MDPFYNCPLTQGHTGKIYYGDATRDKHFIHTSQLPYYMFYPIQAEKD